MRRMRCLPLALALIFQWRVGVALQPLGTQGAAIITTITRQNNGDLFAAQGAKCSAETCVGLSSGTARVSSEEPCTCQCHSHLPAFREDLQICVDDIHECVLSPFVSGSTSQQIPFVFLPLKGQIIHPSKQISFAGIRTPLCAVSGAKFLTDGGWIDLRNPVDTDVPFRLFRDEGRTFLQWVGEAELRNRMGGRLVLVHLMCREIANNLDPTPDPPTIFTPCVAFRVVGTPMKYLNVSEVVFAPDVQSGGDASSGLSVSEYVAIGICSVLLGLIYVASVFLYLHIRRRRKEVEKRNARSDSQGLAEEGVVKSNPLMNLVRHFPAPENTFSDSNSSDTEPHMDSMQHEERKKNVQLTSAMIHPQYQHKYEGTSNQIMHQESIERLPEENVSIVETVEGREDRPDPVKVIGTARRKLYFNPAYFEPHLLIAPPPAAIEFLTKIREVISIAKQKMAAKKFTPNLMGIPEEDPSYQVEVGSEFAKIVISRRGSSVSLKRENSRRKACTGCPGCEPQDLTSLSGKVPHYSTLGACGSCALNSDSKQQSIRKWLEDVPTIKHTERAKSLQLQPRSRKLRSPTRSLSPDHLITPHIRKIAPRPAAEPAIDCETKSASSNRSNRSRKSSSTVKTVRSAARPRAPPPLPPSLSRTTKAEANAAGKAETAPHIYDAVAAPKGKAPLPPPDMIHEAIMLGRARPQRHTASNGSSTSTSKDTPNAAPIINKIDDLKLASKLEYEADSLERSKKGFSTPPEYVDVSSSQPSPSLSGALPMDEEMTMRNAIINAKTGNMTISKISMSNVLQSDDHDYELIVLKKGGSAGSIFKLPELLRRKNTGYSLVSEVYVNNGYNYSSQPSTPTDSDCSTLERAPKIIYEPNKPGHLLIEVEDCPDNYVRAEESDAFEPDTLDRKPKMKLCKRIDGEFVDSLERPKPIMLRSNGTFKKDTSALTQEGINEAFEKSFSSLREIYEAKAKKPPHPDAKGHVEPDEEFEGRILTLEDRHSKRQRRSPVSIPPDIIPPDVKDSEAPIYEHPKPPRPVAKMAKPPLPPKNGTLKGAAHTKYTDVSILNNFIHSEGVLFKNGINNQLILQAAVTNDVACPVDLVSKPKKVWKKVIKVKQDDSGYLSTDSNESHHKKRRELCSAGSETDESLGDGQSESGAESIETHSVFFGSFRKAPNVTSSLDSGCGSDSKH